MGCKTIRKSKRKPSAHSDNRNAEEYGSRLVSNLKHVSGLWENDLEFIMTLLRPEGFMLHDNPHFVSGRQDMCSW